MKTVTKDEVFSVKSVARYKVVGMRYPKYLEFSNAIATIVRSVPEEEDKVLHQMVSMSNFHEGTLYLEDTRIAVQWNEPVQLAVNMYHYC